MYFNEFNFSNCGHCDVCLANRPANYDYTKTKILDLLKKQPHTLETLKQKLKLFNDETWIRVFNELVDDGIVVWQNTGYTLK
jgi:predicted transcriptional regulator